MESANNMRQTSVVNQDSGTHDSSNNSKTQISVINYDCREQDISTSHSLFTTAEEITGIDAHHLWCGKMYRNQKYMTWNCLRDKGFSEKSHFQLLQSKEILIQE